MPSACRPPLGDVKVHQHLCAEWYSLVPDIKTGLAYHIYQCNRAAVTAGNPFSGLRMDNKGWWSVTSVKWGGTVMSGNIQ